MNSAAPGVTRALENLLPTRAETCSDYQHPRLKFVYINPRYLRNLPANPNFFVLLSSTRNRRTGLFPNEGRPFQLRYFHFSYNLQIFLI